jgi:isoleucyl-tRNA synthetase
MDEIGIQENIREFWTAHRIHELSVSRNKSYPKVTIYDGPPFPTGPPHHGHMMTSTVKDTVARYLMATGHYIPRQLGWDMYGPNNRDPEQTEKYIDCWNRTLNELGRWVDGKGYRTSSDEYVESVWWVFKSLWTKGHLRRGYDLTPYCCRCDLYYSDFERHQQQCEVKERTIQYRVPVRCIQDTRIKALLVWEMWPWTLMSVTGYAISSSDEYVIDGEGTLMSNFGGGAKLEPVVIPSLDALNPVTGEYVPVVRSPLIVANKGTGIVRLSPFMDVRSRTISIPPITAEHVPELKSSQYVIELLKERGCLVSEQEMSRNDSACPKCNDRLITYPCHGIYYNIGDNRETIRKTLESIYWEPKSSRDRILQYLDSARDWLITRNTRKGISVPIWVSDAGEHLLVGSYAELQELKTGSGTPLPHTITHMGTVYKHLSYQFDNWFDSACMPYGSVGYPFRTTKMELVHSLFPCRLAIEGVDQIYGWFFTTNVISSSLFNGPAFENIITNGLVLDDGVKMSKSKMPRGEGVAATNTYGADTYRIYLMQNRLLSGIDFNYNSDNINGYFTRGMVSTFNHIMKQIIEGASVNIKFRPTRITNITDNWILQALDDYLIKYHEFMTAFKVAKTLSLCSVFLGHIKKYVHYNLKRLNTDETISVSVIVRVFYYYLMTVAPFAPHISEYLYQQLRARNWIPDTLSIHLCQILNKQWRINKSFLKSSDIMFRIIDLVKKLPAQSGPRVKVHLHDITLIRGVDGYISEVTGKDIVYSDGLSNVMKATVQLQHYKVFQAADRELLATMSLEQIMNLDNDGYYRNSTGIKTYPGQYRIKYEPIQTRGQAYCGCGVLVKGGAVAEAVEPSLALVDSREVIIKGQIVGRRIQRNMKTTGGKCVIYIEHPPISDIQDERAKVLVLNINRYTLPILSQSIYQYRNGKDSLITINISVFSTPLAFYLVPVDEDLVL